MMMRCSILLIVCACIFLNAQSTFAQVKTYEFEQIDSLQKIEKRNVVVFMYTDWCKYCELMKHTTFKNDSIIDVLNRDFYFVSFNAEDKRTIVFNHNTFAYKPTGTNTGTNELAYQLGTLDNKLSFPALCFLNSSNEIIFQYAQYIDHSSLYSILKATIRPR